MVTVNYIRHHHLRSRRLQSHHGSHGCIQDNGRDNFSFWTTIDDLIHNRAAATASVYTAPAAAEREAEHGTSE
jgi:hypothetical protein